MLIIPKAPSRLLLPIGRLWNGEKSPDFRLSSFVELQNNNNDLLIRATTPPLPGYKDDQTEKDINSIERLCLFLVDDDGQYLEFILSIDGRWLAAGFEKPNQKVAEFNEAPIKINHQKEKDGKIINETVIPPDLLPSKLRALNVFLITGTQTLAYHPLLGPEPNLHQPDSFPLAKME